MNERLYALTDASGSTNAIAAIDGTVIERFVYGPNGRPQAVGADWSNHAGGTSKSGPNAYATCTTGNTSTTGRGTSGCSPIGINLPAA